jgi:hypothetical protein
VLGVIALLLIYPFTLTFALIGALPLAICIAVSLLALKYSKRLVWPCGCGHYDRIFKVVHS